MWKVVGRSIRSGRGENRKCQMMYNSIDRQTYSKLFIFLRVSSNVKSNQRHHHLLYASLFGGTGPKDSVFWIFYCTYCKTSLSSFPTKFAWKSLCSHCLHGGCCLSKIKSHLSSLEGNSTHLSLPSKLPFSFIVIITGRSSVEDRRRRLAATPSIP